MSKGHLKRIALPRTWNVPRKSWQRQKMKFISRPHPGKPFELCTSVNTFLKEMIQVAETKKEVKALLQFKHVFVNGKRVRDERFPVGLFDVVYLEESKESFRLTLNHYGKLAAVAVDDKEKEILIKKIERKTNLKGGKIQLNTFGGYNVIVDKNQGKVGDVLVVEKQNIKESLSLDKGKIILLIAGRHIGSTAKVVDVQGNVIRVDIGDQEIETLKEYAYVIGDKKPIITIRT